MGKLRIVKFLETPVQLTITNASNVFNDAEGDPAITASVTNTDGTSTYAARRDHKHALDITSLTEDLTPDTTADYVITYDASATSNKKVKLSNLPSGGGGAGTVTSVSVTTANGVSGTVATATTTPAISLTLGAITPSSIVASGTVAGSNLSGTNTGDQTITLTSDVTGSGTGSFATTIASGAVTLSKMANMATSSLIYRKTAGSGTPEVNTLSTLKTDLGLTGTNSGDQTITLTSDVTGSGSGSFATTIANSAVTLAKMADMATASFIGRNTAGTGAPEVLSVSTAKSILSLTGTNSGDQTITLTSDVTGSGSGSFATTIATSAVTLAKMADVATSSVFYRKTAGTGAPEVNTLATLKTDLGLTGTNSGDQTITLTGDITGTGTGSFATTIGAGKVTNTMLAGSIDLTTKVTGVLPVANGGTGAATLTGVLIGTGTTAVTTKTNPTGAFLGDTDSQNVSGKIFTDSVKTTLTTAFVANQGGSFTSTLAFNTPTAARTLTFPDATGTVLLSNNTATVTNKTMSGASNTFSNIPWSALTAATATTTISMAANTTTMTYNATTGASTNMFNITDTASNTGTGSILNVTTATSSAASPLHVSAAGTEAIYVKSDGSVGIGTTSPLFTMHMISSTSATGAIVAEGYTFAPQFILRRAQGTVGSPTAVTTGQDIFVLSGRGYVAGTTNAFSGSQGKIKFTTEENWGDTARGTRIVFENTQNGTASSLEKMRIDNAGLVGIGTTSTTLAARLQVNENGTLGNEVMRIESTTTNDFPSEKVYQNKVLTTDATVTTIHTFTVPASTTYAIHAYVTARRTGGVSGTAEDGAYYEIVGTYKNVAGTATIIGAVNALVTQESQAAWDATFTVTGATVLCKVTGAASNNVSWAMTAKVHPIGT